MYIKSVLFPNKIIHSWTHEGMYYAINTGLEIFRSSNKFKFSSSKIGQLPSVSGNGMIVYGVNRSELIDAEIPGNVPIDMLNLIVRGSFILHEQFHLELGLLSHISNDYGQSWTTINLQVDTPGHVTGAEGIWRSGLAAFMVIDDAGCDNFIFKPMFKKQDDDSYNLSGWLVFTMDGTLVHNSADPTLNKLNIERRFESSGQLLRQFDNKLNSMDGHAEKYRKPYILRWPNYEFGEDTEAPKTVDHSGYVVNAFDAVSFRENGKTHWIVQIPQEISIKLGLLAEKENKYLPDHIKMRVPVHYVFNTAAIKNATVEHKAPVRVLDLYGFDTFLAPLHKAHVTSRAAVYKFIEKMIGKTVPMFDTYGKPGTIYSYDAPSGETFSERVTLKHFTEHFSGDLFKITDPEFGQDIVAFLCRDRVKICVRDPSKEHNWVDKSRESTFIRSAQRIRSAASVAAMGTNPNNARQMVSHVWCGYDTVLRYDYENNRVLGYPIYALGEGYEPEENLAGYNFPAFIRVGANNYTVGYSTVGGVVYQETNVSRQFNANDIASDEYTDLYYGGFVGDTRGYVGSLTKFVNGIVVPPEPEIPTEPIPNPPTSPNPPLAVPATIALLDDITHSTSAIIASNRRAVEFNRNRGSAIANIAVGNSRWYIELNGITTPHLFFGVAKPGFDVTKEPGEDSSVVAVGIDGSVIRGGTLIYKTSAPLINFTQGGTPTIGVVIDMENRILQFTNGDGNYYSQAIGGLPTGSLYFFIGATANTTNNLSTSVAINFGQLPFKYTVPNGAHRGYGIA